MTSRAITSAVSLIAVLAAFMGVSSAAAQLLSDRPKEETASAPRGRMAKKKKPPMTALPANLVEPKKTADGWPDLQGIWASGNYAGGSQHSLEVGRDPGAILVQGRDPEGDVGNSLVDPMRGMIPYQPWAQAKRMENLAGMY